MPVVVRGGGEAVARAGAAVQGGRWPGCGEEEGHVSNAWRPQLGSGWGGPGGDLGGSLPAHSEHWTGTDEYGNELPGLPATEE